jgi:hypothetical protein
MFDAELESFKRNIDLRSYAAGLGYERDAKESWSGSDVMRQSSTNDKIVVSYGTKRAPNHWGYYSFRNDDDHGSIIDFAQRRLKISLGAIRKELRPWIGEPPIPVPTFPPAVRTSRDRSSVEADYARMQSCVRHPYLENERALPPSLLSSDRFAGRIRINVHGAAVFPHFGAEGLSGYELKGPNGFTGFASGGSKALWLSHEFPDDNKLVLCESAIDALSHSVLFPDNRARYGSIGGKPSPQQNELIRAATARMPPDSEIVSAMDADAEGAKLAEVVRKAVELTGRLDLKFKLQEPFGHKDWNDILRAKSQLIISSRPEVPPVA